MRSWRKALTTSNASTVTVSPVAADLAATSLPDFDGAIINNEYATKAGLSPDSIIATDDPSDPASLPYVNVFATREGDADNETYQKLVQIYQDTKSVTDGVVENSGGTALVTKVPGLTLFAPSSYQELGQMLHDALDLCTGPAVIRWAKTAAPSVDPDDVGTGLTGRKVRTGRDLCILAVGKMLGAATEAAEVLAAEILRLCIRLGGSITGEHGVGAAKLPYLEQRLGADQMALLRRVKAAFDPAGILNPGKTGS